MPTATAKPAPTEKVQTTTITKKISEPVEKLIEVPAAPLPEPTEDFWKYIESLTTDDWKRHHVSLYRYPLGQTKPQKLGRYIKTYKAENPLVSEDQIFDEFGGSQYDALLKGPAKDGSGRLTLIAKHSWEMDGPAKNPWTTPPSAPGTVAPSDTTAVLDLLLKHLQSLQVSKNPAQDPALKESIGLILTDAEMPEMDGYVLTRHIKDDKRFEGIPVVMHSSLSSVANQKLGQQVGVDAYVPKFSPEDLAKMISGMLQHA